MPAALAEVDRLESTIASILALARDVGMARDPVRLAPLLDGVRRDWDRSAHAAGRPLIVRVEPANQAARVSEHALRQILDVLIDNALRHGRGRIVVSAYPVASGVTVDVSDDGIVALDGTAIFARRSPTARGHGIGLALARSLAEAEGGRLSLASGGAGATFSLLLPGPDPQAT
jgi:signal transduction histidine kinase